VFLVPPKLPHHKPSATELVIEKRYSQFMHGVKSLNGEITASWLKSNAAPGFFYRTFAGKSYTAQGTQQLLTAEFQYTRAVPVMDTKLTNFAIHPSEAFCTVTSHLVLLLAHNRKLVSDSTAIDDWVLGKGGWKIKSMVETFSKFR
jgi:hypothetical protein